MECACLMCHGPIIRRYHGGAPANLCSKNCRAAWRKTGGIVGADWWTYEDLRMLHFRRRRMMGVVAMLERMLDDQGLLLVGGAA